MFEQTRATSMLGAVIPSSAQGLVIVVLSMLAAVLVLVVIALMRRMTLRVGPVVLQPTVTPSASPSTPPRLHRHRSRRISTPRPEQEVNGDSSVHSLAELGAMTGEKAPEPTQPFDLAEVNDAMGASETMRAIEALRAVEARRSGGSDSFSTASVRSFKMPVCPLFVLYEVSGATPRVHVVPSDLRKVEVGRSPECTIFSSNPSVSQHHFRFVITPGGSTSRKASYAVEIEDCGSRNGTWVNHEKVHTDTRRTLRDGDIIEAASSRYLFYYVMRSDS